MAKHKGDKLQPKGQVVFSKNQKLWAIALLLLGLGGDTLLSRLQQSDAGLVVALLCILVAVLLVLDIRRLSFLKQAFWRRDNVALILLAGIEIIAIVSIKQYTQNELNKHYPNLSVTNSMVGYTFNEQTKQVDFKIEVTFNNKGDRPAYRLHFLRVVALLEKPQDAKLLPDVETSGDIGVGEQVIIPITFSVSSVDGVSATPATSGITLYWDLQYADSLNRPQRILHNEKWAVIYANNPRLAYMPKDVQDVFEVFVNRVLGKNKPD